LNRVKVRVIPLPLIPSSPRRRLYEPEATRGWEMGLFTNSSFLISIALEFSQSYLHKMIRTSFFGY
jgi:hypothetical protein